MKNIKFYLIIISLSLPLMLQAQLEKGSLMLGGNMAFNSFQEGGGKRTSTLRLTGNAAYFPINNIAVGAGVGFFASPRVSLQLNPFARFFYKKVFAQLGFNRSSQKYTDFNGVEYIFKNMTYNGKIGYALFVNDHISIEPSFFYRIYKSKTESITQPDPDWAKQGREMGLSLGLQIYL